MRNSSVSCRILPYLEGKGVKMRKEGNLYRCSSPFSSDSTWSFTIYPKTDSFYDFSNRFGGSFEVLVSKLEGVSIKEAYTKQTDSVEVKQHSVPVKQFSTSYFKTTKKTIVDDVDEYANSRGIVEGYEPATINIPVEGELIKLPAILFIHRDENLKVTGGKFRLVPKHDKLNQRFTARGKLAWYVLDNLHIESYLEPRIYIVESETSANSLWMYLRSYDIPAVVLSAGAVGATPEIPHIYKGIADKRVVIDYDGSEEKFNERSNIYRESYEEVAIVKIVLPKGEDISSLYAEKRMYLVENLI
jgi:hypothetical protein